MRRQLLEPELEQPALTRICGEVQQPEVAEVAGDHEIRALMLGQRLDVVQCLCFSLDQVRACGLHFDQRGAGDQGVDVTLAAGRGTLRALLVHRRGRTGDPEDPQQIAHERLRLATLIPLRIAPLRHESSCSGADIGQYEQASWSWMHHPRAGPERTLSPVSPQPFTPYPAPPAGRSSEMRARYPRYYAQRYLLGAAESVVAGYQRAVAGGTPVSMSHSWRDLDVPDESVQVIVGGERLLLTVEEWLDRIELAQPHLMSWQTAGYTSRARKTAPDADAWSRTGHEAIRRANPGRR